MNILQYLKGKIRIRIHAADVSKILSVLYNKNIYIESVHCSDPFTLETTIYRQAYHTVCDYLSRYTENISVIGSDGLFQKMIYIYKRPVFWVSLFLLLCLTIYIPQRILFVRVEGNDMVPSRLIAENATKSGIYIGARRKYIQNEPVKNALLEEMSQLQWVGINTKGCVATISVKEKAIKHDETEMIDGISSIISNHDGIIQEITVEQGTAMCKVGQAVTEGQTLISGYTDCQTHIQGTNAQGEILAQTNRDLEVIVPSNTIKRGRLLKTTTNYYIQSGKKLINLSNNSRISDASCVRIYNKYILTLPGKNALPLCLIKETILYYELTSLCADEATHYDWVKDVTLEYLNSQIIPRKITPINETEERTNEIYSYKVNFKCLEVIGTRKKEELVK